MIYDRQAIEKILPQKPPFVFVDRVMVFEMGNRIETEFDMDETLPFFAGHFPEDPIMPGALTLEALAQTSGLIIALSEHNPDGKKYYLASANIKYTGVARSGGVLKLKSSLVRKFGELAQFEVEAFNGNTQTARGTLVLSSAVSISK